MNFIFDFLKLEIQWKNWFCSKLLGYFANLPFNQLAILSKSLKHKTYAPDPTFTIRVASYYRKSTNMAFTSSFNLIEEDDMIIRFLKTPSWILMKLEIQWKN
jgi:hypothetical protein